VKNENKMKINEEKKMFISNQQASQSKKKAKKTNK